MDSQQLIRDIRGSLVNASSNPDEYVLLLQKLAPIIPQTGQSASSRQSINDDPDSWSGIVDILTESFNHDVGTGEDVSVLYIRLFRGVLLLARNLVVDKPDAIDLPLFLLSLQHFHHRVTVSHPFFEQTLVVYFQVLANMTSPRSGDLDSSDKVDLGLLNDSFNPLLEVIENSPSLLLPFLVFINNTFSSSLIYDLLTFEKFDGLISFLRRQFESYVIEQEDGHQLAPVLVQIFSKLVSHESYNKWITPQAKTDPDTFVTNLRINQLVVTSSEAWDNYQLTAILSWVWDLFQYTSSQSQNLLTQPESNPHQLKVVHKQLIILLDILSDICKLNAAKDFLTHYSALDHLIVLLRVVNDKVERKTLKQKEQEQKQLQSKQKIEDITNSDKPITRKEFPQVKSLIIEIMSYLIHESFEAQEKMRELHGLELILSNCMIDDNDPFIKERSIVCLKFLLAGNKANQQFVADLEAQKTYDDQALKDVGYEVEIEDGKVKLKQSEQTKQIYDKVNSGKKN